MSQEVKRFRAATEILYGINSLALLAQEAKKLGITKLIFVTDPGPKEAGALDNAFQSLREAGMPFVVYDKVPQNPYPDTVIEEAVRLLKEEGCDGVVAVGGGSGLGAGRSAAVFATNPGKLQDIFGLEKYRNPPLPCIAVPSTAGSGAEVSQVSRGIRGKAVAPKLAILDPLILRTVPRQQAIDSGVDAWAHAIEGFCCTETATPVTEALALRAIGMISRAFAPSVMSDNLEAKGSMLLASSMANLAFGNGGSIGLSHTMNHAAEHHYTVHGYPRISYGSLHCILLPIVMEFNLPAEENRFAEMAWAMGVAEPGKSDLELGRKAVDRLKSVLVSMGARQGMFWEGLTPEELLEMARPLAGRIKEQPYPRKPTESELVSLFDKANRGWNLD
ncbi:MAG: iron-containing alcohol dehydrogenase [Chloroflexi bacterium]|nr:iron-containing alcohol dehydrogenase [Chloroflexota bacterium]